MCTSNLYAQTSFFWNGADTAANPAGGGTGNWAATNSWRLGSESGAQGTWAAATGGSNAAVLGGTAGTITLGTVGTTNFTGSSMTVNTTGYSITSSSGSRNLVMTGSLLTASGVELTLDLNNTNAIWGFRNLALGDGSLLRLQGIATANNANRINLSGATISSGGSIVLSGTGTGTTGFVSTSGTSTLNSNILNNSSTSATMLGATGGNQLVYNGIVSGSANLQISAGQAGGAGITTLNNVSTYSGNTFLNAATNGVTRIGVDNAIPSGTTVFFGASAGGGNSETGGSMDLNGNDLAVGGLEKVTTSSRGIGNNTSTMSTLTIGKASGTNTFNGVIGTVTNSNLTTQSGNISVVKTGGSTQILNNANTYTGSTTINGGTLALGANGSIASSSISVGTNGTFDVSAVTGGYNLLTGRTLSGDGTIVGNVTIDSGAFLNPGTSPGSLAFTGDLTNSGTITIELDSASSFDTLLGNGSNVFTLGGTLNIVTNFTPVVGQTFNIFSGWQNIVGNFSTINGADLGGGLSWQISTSGGNLSFSAVPEPSSMALLGLVGLGGFAVRRFRHKKVQAAQIA